uniref:Putative secreted protein n=1 Tax=Anopheles darlingi TaxID=43151 RepID=A0A2M4DPQ8_ANODA
MRSLSILLSWGPPSLVALADLEEDDDVEDDEAAFGELVHSSHLLRPLVVGFARFDSTTDKISVIGTATFAFFAASSSHTRIPAL